MNRFKTAGIRIAAACAMIVASAVGVVAPTYAADPDPAKPPTAEQQILTCSDIYECTISFFPSWDGTYAIVILRFNNAYSFYYDVNLWDGNCDSHSAYLLLDFDLEGQSSHEQMSFENGQGCNTWRDWFNQYKSFPKKILAVRAIPCKRNYWGSTCGTPTGWTVNPAY